MYIKSYGKFFSVYEFVIDTVKASLKNILHFLACGFLPFLLQILAGQISLTATTCAFVFKMHSKATKKSSSLSSTSYSLSSSISCPFNFYRFFNNVHIELCQYYFFAVNVFLIHVECIKCIQVILYLLLLIITVCYRLWSVRTQ